MPAVGLVLALGSALVIHIDDDGLVVDEQDHVSPFFYQGRCLFLELELEPVIGSKLVRLLELAHLSVGREHDIDPDVNYFL